MDICKCCSNCKHWYTNDSIKHIYDEGEGRCTLRGELTFCDKHNCAEFSPKPTESDKEDF